MKNVKVTQRPHVIVSLTADEWELYMQDGQGWEYPRETIAKMLNHRIERAINDSQNRIEAINKITITLAAFSDWGANDTEGHLVATKILDLAYPQPQ
jgi:hypothetical protein